MKNLAGMMKQAQQMQQKMAEMQAKLEAAEVEGVAGAGLVRVTLTGKGALKGIKIDPKLIDPSDAEMLEDLVVAAHAVRERCSPSFRPVGRSSSTPRLWPTSPPYIEPGYRSLGCNHSIE